MLMLSMVPMYWRPSTAAAACDMLVPAELICLRRSFTSVSERNFFHASTPMITSTPNAPEAWSVICPQSCRLSSGASAESPHRAVVVRSAIVLPAARP
jgi:hypothetical protein